MSDTTSSTAAVVDADVPEWRTCSRCDGAQHLVALQSGMGKYRCEECELQIGFDLEAQPAEFLLSRGLPGRYTKSVFGTTLATSERQLP